MPQDTKEEIQKNKIGRPTKYTQELEDKICSELAEGRSLRSVCLDEDMPDKATVFRWLRENKSFSDHYARAKEESADADLEELQDISNEAIAEAKIVSEKRANAVVQAYKVKGDNLKWKMSKMKPKKYGDKLDMTSDGKAITVELINYTKDEEIDHKPRDKDGLI